MKEKTDELFFFFFEREKKLMNLPTRVIIITEFQNLVSPHARGRRLQTIRRTH